VISVKEGVKLSKLQPQMALATAIAHECFTDYGCNLTITSGEEWVSQRLTDSLHYEGLALDYRTRDIPVGFHEALIAKIRWALGDQFDVVPKPNHLHVEFDPKRG
jgi:hypothetical protein